ncbi:uncharacterized protein LOC111615075 isoform X4 [Centruroides sculpturatus]|uniref:uncharacterized protein LOC111615075 isoform X4 n=2 Tax=Centruroides sculpturatus TaxID=218467 RepID=UPI000C6CA0EF|nr:uncharacterized protein LOC111615075 isoform X4 [Centruroides sculpturatus]
MMDPDKGLERLYEQRERYIKDVQFFRCHLREETTLKTLQLRKSIRKDICREDVWKIERLILKSVIRKKGKSIGFISKQIKSLKKDLNQNLILDSYKNKNYIKNKNTKLFKLFGYPLQEESVEWQKNLVQNLSSKEIPEDYMRFLSYGAEEKDEIRIKICEDLKKLEIKKGRIQDHRARHYIENKKQEIISEGSFKKLEKDPFNEIQRTLTRKLKKFVKEGHIQASQSKEILSKENVRIPKLTVRIKTHKQNKCRPIIDFRFTLLYNLEIFIKKILQDIQISKYAVKNADDLITKLQKGVILSNYKLMSLDITSMYPSITKDMILSSLRKYGVPDYLKDLITFTLDNNYFTVKEKNFYRQTEGISMGSVIGPKLAEIYMLDVDMILSTLNGVMFFARTTNIDKRKEEIEDTHKKYILNGYPKRLLNDWFHRFLRNRFKVKRCQEIIKYVSFPYIKGIYEKYNNFFNHKLIRLAPSLNNRLSNMMIIRNNAKDILEEEGVVYRIECTCNNPSFYVGETKRRLRIRLSEHLAAVRLKMSNSPVFQHCNSNNCQININKLKIIFKEKNIVKRKVKEHFAIIMQNNNVNLNTGMLTAACWEFFVNCISGSSMS